MADPIDQVLDEIDPNAPQPEAPPAAAPSGVTLTIEQYEELRRAAEQPRIEPVVTQPQTAPPPQNEQQQYDERFFTGSPSAATVEIAQRVMAGPAQAMNEKLGGLAIKNFISSKTSDPFFNVAIAIFNKEIANMPKASLGAMDDSMIDRTLNLAWNSAVGQYVAKKQSEKPKAPPVNLGGGGASGGASGPKEKKTLAEIDPIAYRIAIENGWSEEQMAQTAEEILNEQD